VKRLQAFDRIVLAYLAVVAGVVLLFRPPGTPVYLALHAAAAALVIGVAEAYERRGGAFWRACRYWYPLVLAPAAFKEVHFLMPGVHPFQDDAWDQLLADIDRKLFGDVDVLFLALPGPIVDLLHLCYWFYYVSMILLGVVLYRERSSERIHEYLAILTLGLFGSYLGYYLVPAVGPHWFYADRPAALDGWILGGPMHRFVILLEGRMPDAFPSGHALMSMLVMATAWKMKPALFRAMVVPCSGCILATVALRYHYVVDVLVSALVFPVVWFAGIRLNRRREDALAALPPRVP
jgi:hypothetical protein